MRTSAKPAASMRCSIRCGVRTTPSGGVEHASQEPERSVRRSALVVIDHEIVHYEHPPGRQRFVSEAEQVVDGASTYSTEQIRHENNVVALRPFPDRGVCFVVVDTIAEARLVDEVSGDVQRVRKIEDRGAQPRGCAGTA